MYGTFRIESHRGPATFVRHEIAASTYDDLPEGLGVCFRYDVEDVIEWGLGRAWPLVASGSGDGLIEVMSGDTYGLTADDAVWLESQYDALVGVLDVASDYFGAEDWFDNGLSVTVVPGSLAWLLACDALMEAEREGVIDDEAYWELRQDRASYFADGDAAEVAADDSTRIGQLFNGLSVDAKYAVLVDMYVSGELGYFDEDRLAESMGDLGVQ